MKTLDVAEITILGDIPLQERDGHKLRGYIAELFKEESPLLHNHLESGNLRYGYPLIQYKVIDSVAHLIGLAEGARLLNDLFLRIDKLVIGETFFPVYSKNISFRSVEIGVCDTLQHYRFVTPWMALNQDNSRKYNAANSEKEKNALLVKTITGNFLSMFKSLNYTAAERILAQASMFEKTAQFKGNAMIVFEGHFVANVMLPDHIGLGKSTARGFGTIEKEK